MVSHQRTDISIFSVVVFCFPCSCCGCGRKAAVSAVTASSDESSVESHSAA